MENYLRVLCSGIKYLGLPLRSLVGEVVCHLLGTSTGFARLNTCYLLVRLLVHSHDTVMVGRMTNSILQVRNTGSKAPQVHLIPIPALQYHKALLELGFKKGKSEMMGNTSFRHNLKHPFLREVSQAKPYKILSHPFRDNSCPPS